MQAGSRSPGKPHLDHRKETPLQHCSQCSKFLISLEWAKLKCTCTWDQIQVLCSNSASRTAKAERKKVLPLPAPTLFLSQSLSLWSSYGFFNKKLCPGLSLLHAFCLLEGCFAKTFCHHCCCSLYLWECKSSVHLTIFL